MEKILENKVAVLTGGGGGIGRAIAEKLATHKMKIVLFGGNNQEKLRETQAVVEKYTECMLLPGDLTNEGFIAVNIVQVIEKFGGGPVGLETLAAATGEDANTIEDVYEPYLLQLGFIARTSRGRICLRDGYYHMGFEPSAKARKQISMFEDE